MADAAPKLEWMSIELPESICVVANSFVLVVAVAGLGSWVAGLGLPVVVVVVAVASATWEAAVMRRVWTIAECSEVSQCGVEAASDETYQDAGLVRVAI